MNQSQFARIFKEKAGISSIEKASKIVDHFFDTLNDALRIEDSVIFSGHGRFKLKTIKAKPIVHPITKQEMQTTEKVVAQFKNADKFKKRLNAVK